LRAFIEDEERDLGLLPSASERWLEHTALLGQTVRTDPTAAVNVTGRHGTGTISVTDVRTLDAGGHDTHHFRHGEPFTLQVHYQVNIPDLKERAQVLVAFHRDGVTDVCRVWTRDLIFDARRSPQGLLQLRWPRLLLGNGTFTITLMIAKEGYYDSPQAQYFSLNPGVFSCLSRVMEIVVADAGIVGTGTGVVAEGEWTLLDDVKTLSVSDGAQRSAR
jgi:hypothetical protein